MSSGIYIVLSFVIAILVRPRMRVDPNYRRPSAAELERRAFSRDSFFQRDQEMNEQMIQSMLHRGIPFAIFVHAVWVAVGLLLLKAPSLAMALIFGVLVGFFLGISWRAIDVARARRSRGVVR